MGIDYVVNRQCQLKNYLGDRFLSLVAKRNRYDYFQKQVGVTPGFTETTVFDDVYLTDKGVVREPTNLLMMRLELGELAQGGLECFSCGVNCRQTFGGCWGYIGFPIFGVVEKLLLTTIQAYIKAEGQSDSSTNATPKNRQKRSVGGIVESMQSAKQNQQEITSWRQNGLTELAQPLQCKWGSFWKKHVLTTDQILSFLFAENLTTNRLQQAAKFLNIFDTSVEAGLQAASAKNSKVAGYQEQIRQQLLPFKQFTKACLMAAELGEDIQISTTT